MLASMASSARETSHHILLDHVLISKPQPLQLQTSGAMPLAGQATVSSESDVPQALLVLLPGAFMEDTDYQSLLNSFTVSCLSIWSS